LLVAVDEAPRGLLKLYGHCLRFRGMEMPDDDDKAHDDAEAHLEARIVFAVLFAVGVALVIAAFLLF